MNAQNPGDAQPPNNSQGQPPQQNAPQGHPAPQGQAPQYGAPAPQGYPTPDGQAPQGYPGPQGQPGQGYAPQGQQNSQPGYAEAAPTQKPAGGNPFAGIPAVDFVMDGLAALLLLIALGLPWNVMNRATDRLEVILLLVLSLLSLSVHYLERFGVFPNTWPPRLIAMMRAALNLPFLLLVLVYVVLDALTTFGVGDGNNAGLGGAAALGLAGALLAAAPRRAQINADYCPLQRKVWPLVFFGLSGLAIVLQLVAVIAVFLGELSSNDLKINLLHIVTILTIAAITGWALFGVFRRDHSWRLVAGALGITAGCAFVFLWAGESTFNIINVQSTLLSGLAIVFLPALGALALTPIIKDAMKPKPADQVWTGAARSAAEYLVLVAGSTVLVGIFGLIANGMVGATIAVLIMSLIIAIAGLLARVVLTKDVGAGRNQALVLTGVATLFAIVALIITASSDDGTVGLGLLLLAFGLPAVIFIGLTAPKSVREHFTANPPAALAMPTQHNSQQPPQANAGGQQAGGAPQQYQGAPQQYQQDGAPQQYQQGAPEHQNPTQSQQAAPVTQQPWEAQQQAEQGQPPAQPLAAQPQPEPEQAAAPASEQAAAPAPEQAAAPAHGFTAATAADPSTDLNVLGQIAQEAPELRAVVAGNPSTYPDLVGWLGSLNDPEVNAAIAARQA